MILGGLLIVSMIVPILIRSPQTARGQGRLISRRTQMEKSLSR